MSMAQLLIATVELVDKAWSAFSGRSLNDDEKNIISSTHEDESEE